MDTATAYIAMGANLGDRARALMRAAKMMDDLPGLTVRRVSSLTETEPLGGPADQPNYLNGVAEVKTALAPPELLAALHAIEAALGRDRSAEQRWGPRTCDLDILLIDDVILQTDALTIPHPRMCEREFVLAGLAEIAPDAVHPVLNKTTADLLAALCGGDRGETRDRPPPAATREITESAQPARRAP